MWIDERGSEVLGLAECQQLLAIGAAQHHPGHLGIQEAEAPTVLPVDYTVDGGDILIRVGEGLFGNIIGKLVAFEVESTEEKEPWSVLVRGLALADDSDKTSQTPPSPRVASPGKKIVRIRSDAVTGRRLGLGPT
jgi:hypothetical protein